MEVRKTQGCPAKQRMLAIGSRSGPVTIRQQKKGFDVDHGNKRQRPKATYHSSNLLPQTVDLQLVRDLPKAAIEQPCRLEKTSRFYRSSRLQDVEDAAARRSLLSHNVTMRLHTRSKESVQKGGGHIICIASARQHYYTEANGVMACCPENLHDRIVAVVAIVATTAAAVLDRQGSTLVDLVHGKLWGSGWRNPARPSTPAQAHQHKQFHPHSNAILSSLDSFSMCLYHR